MTLIELLKIFKMDKLYEDKKEYQIPFVYHFSDPMNCLGSSIIFNFNKNEITISIKSKDFSENTEIQKLYLTFNIEQKEIQLVKSSINFKNELFPFLSFDTTLVADLEFVAGIINNILIPKHNLHWTFYT